MEKGRQGGHFASGELEASGARTSFLPRRPRLFSCLLPQHGGHRRRNNGGSIPQAVTPSAATGSIGHGGVAWGDPLLDMIRQTAVALASVEDGSSVRLTRFDALPYLCRKRSSRRPHTSRRICAHGEGWGHSDAENNDGSCTMILPIRGGGAAQLELARGARGGKGHGLAWRRLHGAWALK